jgi:hypothetical protein
MEHASRIRILCDTNSTLTSFCRVLGAVHRFTTSVMCYGHLRGDDAIAPYNAVNNLLRPFILACELPDQTDLIPVAQAAG